MSVLGVIGGVFFMLWQAGCCFVLWRLFEATIQHDKNTRQRYAEQTELLGRAFAEALATKQKARKYDEIVAAHERGEYLPHIVGKQPEVKR